MLQAMNTGHDGRLAADTSVHFGDGARRVGDYVDELMAAFPARIEHRDQHGTAVEYITVPRERAATVTCITVEGRAEATPWSTRSAAATRGSCCACAPRRASRIPCRPTTRSTRCAARWQYIPAREVAVGDWLAAPRRILHETAASTQDEEDSYWAGMLTGDGAISGHMGPDGRRAQYLSLAIDDAGIAQGFGEHLARTFGPEATAQRYGRQDTDARCHQLVCNDAGTARAVAERYALPVGARTRQTRLAWKPRRARAAPLPGRPLRRRGLRGHGQGRHARRAGPEQLQPRLSARGTRGAPGRRRSRRGCARSRRADPPARPGS